ncbi:hypothetical protein D3C85_1272720 [compost metagenome]
MPLNFSRLITPPNVAVLFLESKAPTNKDSLSISNPGEMSSAMGSKFLIFNLKSKTWVLNLKISVFREGMYVFPMVLK